MKTAFALFIVIHGLIHLLGFLKAFELAKINELKMPVTKAAGMIWLLTSFLFVAMAILYLGNSPYYIGVGIAGVTLSQALVWKDWKEAKFGTIPNIIFGLFLFLSI